MVCLPRLHLSHLTSAPCNDLFGGGSVAVWWWQCGCLVVAMWLFGGGIVDVLWWHCCCLVVAVWLCWGCVIISFLLMAWSTN